MAFSSVGRPHLAASSFANRSKLIAFALTLFVSAFLLFSVQPFFAKMVLPRLGGSPAVWSIAMVFFQAMLLAGYLYAHLLSRYLSPRLAALVHLSVMAAALWFLPIAIPSGWESPPLTGQPLWLLGLFTVSVGLPFFAVAANGPLLQSWFSHSGHPHAADPYFLYSASNFGSFASLFLFIVLIEPQFAIPDISKGWMGGFIGLGLLIAICATFLSKGAVATNAPLTTDKNAEPTALEALQILKWVGLSFVPSGLLVAVTAHISTDIAAAPFLWIIPLALFLLTFIFAFARKRIFSVELLSTTTTVLGIVVLCPISAIVAVPVVLNLGLHLCFFLSAALLCHSVLVDQRPAATQLTAFYLWMSFGGVLGGVFASLLAPVIFTQIVEYPILVVLAFFCRPATWQGNNRTLLIASVVAAVFVLMINSGAFEPTFISDYKFVIAIVFCIFGVLSQRYLLTEQSWFLVQTILVVGLIFGYMNSKNILSIDRSFFGVVSVYKSTDDKFTLMAHGQTLHGAMGNTPAGQKPEPVTYYHKSGGVAATLFAAQEKWARTPLGRKASVGIVGLGAGSMLCHRKPNESWTSYEIDKAVVDAAADQKLFRFMSDCGENDPVIIGDARLKLLEEPQGKFDYLLIDAFSSDAIPVHLITDEALQLYMSKLQDDGILALHISNRYMELASVIEAIAKKNGYVGRIGLFEASPAQIAMNISTNLVVVLAKNENGLGSIARSPQWDTLPDLGTKPWTDDHSDLLGALRRGVLQ